MDKKIVLIDGHSILHRAFFGIPDLTNAEGLHTNAVYGFLNILFKILEEEKPDYLTVAFDVHAPTFRHKMFADYKGTRKPMAEELREQVPVMKEVLKSMGVAIVECEGYEADDILGTIARSSEKVGLEVSLVSGDRDLLQLATEHIKIRIPKTKRTGTEIEDYYAADVKEKYQVTPEEFIDVKALMGDASDNIPGVPGIGEKTATALIAAYGSIENAYAHVDELKPPRAQKNLREHYDMAQMSKTLATIEVNAPIDYRLEDAKLGNLFTPEAHAWMKKLEFKQMQSRFPKQEQEAPVQQYFRKITERTEAEQIFAKAQAAGRVGFQFLFEPERVLQMAETRMRREEAENIPGNTEAQERTGLNGQNIPGSTEAQKTNGLDGQDVPGDTESQGMQLAMESDGQLTLEGFLQIQGAGVSAASQMPGAGSFAAVQAQGADSPAVAQAQEGEAGVSARISPILGLALAFGREDIYFLEAGEGMTGAYLAEQMQPLLQKAEAAETFGLKSQLSCFEVPRQHRCKVTDVLIGAYLLNPLKNDYAYDDVAREHLQLTFPSQLDLLGKLPFAQAFREKEAEFFQYACFVAYTSYQASSVIEGKLKDCGMWALFREIEMPLVFTLYDMEQEGVQVNAGELKSYGESLTGRIDELEQEIYQDAGETFNINSPKQLGVILFEKLKMPNGKKTKTGYSTAADVLDKLAPDYPLVSKILEYRQLTKLKSTYADGLANFIRKDGRIHSSFHQTITATGRLSSTDPNLQNIPIRMELGRQIRKVFIPRKGCVLIDADYSQIELRVLAHMSGDENLIHAYQAAQDIHKMTASQVFHIPFEEVTSLQRRNAKAVNFGIVYGISSFGLSQDLSITKKEAAQYIASYFETYPGIKQFLDGLVTDAKEQGFVSTMYGRRRPVPELTSGNFMQRSFGERVAMNAPIQGTAADIIKIAMNRVHDALNAQGLRSRLILQVHDELLVEAYEEEAAQVEAILKKEMETAADLSVALEIDMHHGENWYEAH
ncbi:MAG: DNA polymerase I [Lachnospiraceae bacterium]|nr:DNA polymerase I [Lachnospiraceae bacterium]